MMTLDRSSGLRWRERQWEYGALDDDVLQRVSEISEQGLGLARWQAEGPRVVEKREKAVSEFLGKIRVPNPKPKKRKTARKFPAIFEPGDCLAIPLSDGKLGAAVVVAIDNRDETEGLDFIGLLEHHGAKQPTFDLFPHAPWIPPPDSGPFLPWVSPFHVVLARSFRNEGKGVTRLAQGCVRADAPKYDGAGTTGGWGSVRIELDTYHELLSFADPAARESYFKIRYYAPRVDAHQHAEFEPLLLSGYEELVARQAGIHDSERRQILSNAAKEIAQFYEGWGKPEEAAKWQHKLEQSSVKREA
jgi:hypothetical protein